MNDPRRSTVDHASRLRIAVLVLLALLLTSCASFEARREGKRLAAKGADLVYQGKYAEAEPVLKRALAIREQALGPEDTDVAHSLNDLAELYREQGRYAEAVPLYQRALAILEGALGPQHPDVAVVLMNLGSIRTQQSLLNEAELFYKRALTIREQALGPQDREVAATLNNLGLLYVAQGRFADAEPLYRRAVAILEQTQGPVNLDVARVLGNQATLYVVQGRYADAEAVYQRVLKNLQWLDPNHPAVANIFNKLGLLYTTQGRYADAESAYQGALASLERTLGPEHPGVALTLNLLGMLYFAQGRFVEAEPLYQRALTIQERALGPDHPAVAIALLSLAKAFAAQGRHAEAEIFYQRALTIEEKALGPEHPAVAMALSDLALLYVIQRRYAEAEPLYQRALPILERTLGPEHPELARAAWGIAMAFVQGEQWSKAESLFRPVLGIFEKVLGPQHPWTALTLVGLGIALAGSENFAAAREVFERARRIELAVGQANLDLDEETHRGLEKVRHRWLRAYAKVLALIARSPRLEPGSSWPGLDAFVVADQMRGGLAQSALAKAGARVAAGDPTTANLARQVEELRRTRQGLWKQLAEYQPTISTQGNSARLELLQQTTRKVDRELREATNRLAKAFPRYGDVAWSEPVDIAGIQRILRSDEALVAYLALDDRLLVWLVRPGRKPLYRDLDVKQTDLAELVSRVRTSLDQSKNPALATGRLLPFDVAGAHELYRLLLAPLKEELTGVRNLIVVPDEVLLPLPFGALVTRTEGEAYIKLSAFYQANHLMSPGELTQYAKLDFLTRHYAITVLPSATSLRALRGIKRQLLGESDPFIGFGDPLLEEVSHARGGTMVATRGAAVSVADLRKLGSLPGTRQELLAVAAALGASPSKTVYLREEATKPAVMHLNRSGRLGKARVIEFATHALIAGELKGLKEPALVLTPPTNPSNEDDGLLGLEDILQLKLENTHWVILSGCNTAGPGGSGEGLSGLVRAFFFAGAPSLLVSHWSVEDQATQALMTKIFRRYAADPTLPRAEAVRQGMLALMDGAHEDTAYFAHPFAWASFFLVGEGGGFFK